MGQPRTPTFRSTSGASNPAALADKFNRAFATKTGQVIGDGLLEASNIGSNVHLRLKVENLLPLIPKTALFFAVLTAESTSVSGAYKWQRVEPVATGGDSDLGGFWKRDAEGSADKYTAYEANRQEAILTLYTNLGLPPVFQLFAAGVDANGDAAYVFKEPYITGDEELWCKVTGSSVVTADSKWTYSGYYCRWDGTDWQVMSGSPFSNLLNTYEPVIGGSVYTNGVNPTDISGTSIVPQPVAPGVYRLHRVPIYDTGTLTAITGYTFMISEPNGMSGACS